MSRKNYVDIITLFAVLILMFINSDITNIWKYAIMFICVFLILIGKFTDYRRSGNGLGNLIFLSVASLILIAYKLFEIM